MTIKYIFTYKLAEPKNNQQLQREIMEESMAALVITMEIRTLKQLHQLLQQEALHNCVVNWTAEK